MVVSSSKHLRLATADDARVVGQLVCARPSCTKPVPARDVGRPARFCSPECRISFHKEARLARAGLERAQAVVAQYGVTLPIDFPAKQPRPGDDRQMRQLLAACHRALLELRVVSPDHPATADLQAAWDEVIHSYLTR